MSGPIAIILARSGSKRLHRKNMVDFCGKPMLAWTVEAALEAGVFHRVLVSTDDLEIAEAGRAYGAAVPFLRQEAVDDHAPSSAATISALHAAEQHWSERYDIVAQLMANCPLRTHTDIVEAMEVFVTRRAESQISCIRYGWMSPWWAARLSDDGKPSYVFEEARFQRSQDLPSLYCPTGALWIARAAALVRSGTFFTEQHVMQPLTWISGLDIDDESDLEMARAAFLARHAAGRDSGAPPPS